MSSPSSISTCGGAKTVNPFVPEANSAKVSLSFKVTVAR